MTVSDVSSGTASRVQRHRQMLAVAGAVVVLAFLLEVHPDQRVAFRLFPSWPLPETCPSRSLFHIECPGCGLTRSFVHLAHGDWTKSLAIHRVGWLLALAVVLQFPYRLCALRSQDGAPLGSTVPRLFGCLLIFALIANWMVKLAVRVWVGP
jgi:hypothetical protein